MKLLLLGSSGLVGGHVLSIALADPKVTSVVAPTRRALPAHPKLFAPLVDFDQLPQDASWWQADAVICALGTTMRRAGSQDAFRRVDHDYPLAAATLARRHGTPCHVLNSAIGADAGSRFFYNQVKGELERDLATLGFASLTHVRPGLIGGERPEKRTGEHLYGMLLGVLGPLLPRRFRINPAPRIAHALLEAAFQAPPGVQIISAERLT